jgi:hypothetical protein
VLEKHTGNPTDNNKIPSNEFYLWHINDRFLFLLLFMVSQNISQGQGGVSTSTEDVNNEQCGSKPTVVAPAALFSTQSVRETSTDDPSVKVANTPENWESKLHVYVSLFWLLSIF